MKKLLKEKAIELRKLGKSYGEIAKEVGAAKSSISCWTKNVILTDEQKHDLLIRSTKQLREWRFDHITVPRPKSKKRLEMGEDKWKEHERERDHKKYLEWKKHHDKTYINNWKRQRKDQLVKYKGGKCEICGYNKCIGALDFHHKNPKEKEFSMSKNSFSFEKCKKEADKCLLLCRNCHAEEHDRLWVEQNRKVLLEQSKMPYWPNGKGT